MPVPGNSLVKVEPLERPEQAVGVRHVEAGAVVAHEVGRLAGHVGEPELDARRPASAR